ncbi:malonyl-ACP O-methyltransferase BioC [Agarilytica rhodophyticola]|uniref:malonyl-ACP O-methyltransferase BioC n=1 Tax=Agarilytica rhodophyticola TaxID=1737490 RepID=UPI000B341DE8|nr:malonyl-ACP O-methyltransferase BioC [Agarilytica rhodophyticola]
MLLNNNVTSSEKDINIQYISGQSNNLFPVPLVFIHGWGNDSRAWKPLLGGLQQQRDVYLIDLPGFGTNKHSPNFSLDDFLTQLKALVPDKFHLIGWSLGGMIATQLAAQLTERVCSLTTIASNAKFTVAKDWPIACDVNIYEAFYEGFQLQAQQTLQRFAQLQAKGDGFRKQVVKYIRDTQPLPDADTTEQWLHALTWLNSIDNRNTLKQLALPHLAIFGENDTLVPSAVAQTFFNQGLNAENLVLENTAHAPHISQADKVAGVLREFFDRAEKRCVRDKSQVALSFSHAAKNYDGIADLQRRVVAHLKTFKKQYCGNILDLGCGTGFCIDAINNQDNDVWGLDIAEGMLAFCRSKLPYMQRRLICGDIEKLPLAESSVDGIISSMSIQWCDHLAALFRESERVLKKQGWLLFSTLGPDTLYELRNAWYEVDEYVHINHFENIEHVIFELEQAGFTIQQHVCQIEVLQYQKVLHLMRELKGIGAHNVNSGQNKGLTTRHKLQQLEAAYEKYRIDDFLPASYEVHYFLAKASS